MVTKTVSIIGINDFHAELFETGHALGSAKLCTLVERQKLDNPHTIVVFGGDNFKGDPMSEELSGEPVAYLMKRLGTKVSAVGNHEFEYGLKALGNWSAQGAFTFVAANVLDSRTGEIASGFRPYVMVEEAGTKIALLGLSTRERLDRHGYEQDVRILEIADGAREARKWVDYLNKGADPLGKPDAIIALTHFGFRYTADHSGLVGEEVLELCRQVPELAGVFTAHWHQFISAEVYGVPVVQGGSHGRGFARLAIEFSCDNRVRKVIPDYLDASGTAGEMTPDPVMQGELEEYKRRTARTLGAVIGRLEQEIVHKSPITAEVDMEGTPLTRLVTDIMREQTGCPIALIYSGRMGPGLTAGEVTMYELRKLFYFNDEIVTMKLRGEDLIRNIENGISTLSIERASPIAISGLKVAADYDKPFGARIESILLENGQPLEPDRYYEIAVDEFLDSNEMGYDFSSGIERRYTGIFLRDRTIQTIREQGGMSAELPESILVKNKKEINFGYVQTEAKFL
ncbi:bifunctional metallophosphatase/5'-nucleotidase [Paenibacillus physcomitrellae]|uniref:Multifunctional 2',3'-cyclic-nucleotide 2'-phosphodiesterase/5'-nucleotidase/3'-nucleotidase n=1 Tax=Paenibacillus physcomitrellae TaxID=1619311 RepID=A0ABQ1FKL3_9BACL|nr:5'-nucleotidase C-terminal domain-containing protein [Paenibacillus physcomitrellae]GGA19943.1 multifunctional 2',3'-cyclic-nucleotide 2'-phosphodiesterase/5'-nucleotidase/3'-nucleotidase [Paenibacillus physcomitrellae]